MGKGYPRSGTNLNSVPGPRNTLRGVICKGPATGLHFLYTSDLMFHGLRLPQAKDLHP